MASRGLAHRRRRRLTAGQSKPAASGWRSTPVGLYEVRDPAANEYGRARLSPEMAADRGRIEPISEKVMEAA